MPPHAILNYNSSKSSPRCYEAKSASKLSGLRRRRRDQKTVTFASSDDVRTIENVDELKNLTDISTIWFTDEEYEEIESACWDTIDCIHQDSSLDTLINDDDDGLQHCVRGLENKTKEGRYRLQENRRSALQVVLKEQEIQRNESVANPELLAYAYFHYTSACLIDAQARGLLDSREVLSIQDKANVVANKS